MVLLEFYSAKKKNFDNILISLTNAVGRRTITRKINFKENSKFNPFDCKRNYKNDNMIKPVYNLNDVIFI